MSKGKKKKKKKNGGHGPSIIPAAIGLAARLFSSSDVRVVKVEKGGKK